MTQVRHLSEQHVDDKAKSTLNMLFHIVSESHCLDGWKDIECKHWRKRRSVRQILSCLQAFLTSCFENDIDNHFWSSIDVLFSLLKSITNLVQTRANQSTSSHNKLAGDEGSCRYHSGSHVCRVIRDKRTSVNGAIMTNYQPLCFSGLISLVSREKESEASSLYWCSINIIRLPSE